MKSIIHLTESVVNKDKKFAANDTYYPCRVEFNDGLVGNALFTKNQIEVAIERASKNPEDIPEKTFWESLIRDVKEES